MSGFHSGRGRRGRGFGGGGGGGSDRYSGRGGGGRGDPGPLLGTGGTEQFEFNICRYYVKGNCNQSAETCRSQHIVTNLAQVQATSGGSSLLALAQWQATNAITASADGNVKLWTTPDGVTWTSTPPVQFSPRLPVSAVLVVGAFLFCGYEAPYIHAPAPPARGQSTGKGITVGRIRILNLTGGEPIEVAVDSDKCPYAHPQRVTCLATTPGPGGAGMILFSGGEEGGIRVWKTGSSSNFELATTLNGHVLGVTTLLVSGALLWSSSKDTTIRVWNLESMTCVGVIGSAGGGHTDEVTCMVGPLAVEGDAVQYMVTGSSDTTLRVWNAATGGKVHDCKSFARVTALAAFPTSPAGPLLLVGLENGAIAIRDFPGFNLAFELNPKLFNVGHYNSPVRSLLPMIATGADQFFMSGGDDGKMFMWKMTMPKVKQ